MTGPQLAFLSTVLWVIGTGALFLLLASWSAGGSWGLSAAIVRGVREWSRSNPPGPGNPPGSETTAELIDLGDQPTRPS